MRTNHVSLEKIRELKGKGWKVVSYVVPLHHRHLVEAKKQYKVIPPPYTRLPESIHFKSPQAAWLSAYMQDLLVQMEVPRRDDVDE